MLTKTFLALIATLGLSLTAPAFVFAQENNVQTGYASVNGLKMYYEIHGTGEPLVIIHGAYMSIDLMGEIVPRLAETRQVIAVELQGHGRTADIDRPLSYEAMADDVAALMHEIGIEKADIFGYSIGGAIALQMAIRHPEMVDKLIAASVSYKTEGMYPEVLAGLETITPEVFAGSPYEAEYLRLAPHPEDFPKLVEKLLELDNKIQNWPAEDIQGISAPTLLIVGDSDIVRPEHAVEMFKLLGGGVPADLVGLPNAQLAILPGTSHVTLIDRVELLNAMIVAFLDAPMPEAKS
jgi:pimeloyl-ACP methyl ester carboxylesterase